MTYSCLNLMDLFGGEGNPLNTGVKTHKILYTAIVNSINIDK